MRTAIFLLLTLIVVINSKYFRPSHNSKKSSHQISSGALNVNEKIGEASDLELHRTPFICNWMDPEDCSRNVC